jgi:hypothetical protein
LKQLRALKPKGSLKTTLKRRPTKPFYKPLKQKRFTKAKNLEKQKGKKANKEVQSTYTTKQKYSLKK